MIQKIFPLDFQWPTIEPFLFCVHHLDHYPKGQADLSLDKKHFVGRDMGQDFVPKDGFRMYHGESIPGFPVHPHRGFETITIVRKGYADHADSMGAAGRYGQGDVQWMTAGAGVQHSEMFPMLNQDSNNTLELFQIWLNLPKKSKMAAPFFKMFWHEQIPVYRNADSSAEVSVIAGKLHQVSALAPPPDSWAADSDNEVTVLLIKIAANGKLQIPRSNSEVARVLYFYEGSSISIGDQEVPVGSGVLVDSMADLEIQAGAAPVQILLLQAKPIGEPRFQHGPFVMNTKSEIIQTIEEYQRSQFGGWSWPRPDMVHGNKIERFAKYPDGRIEKP